MRITKNRIVAVAAAGLVVAAALGATVVAAEVALDEPPPSVDDRTGTPFPSHHSDQPQVVAERNGFKYIVSKGTGSAEGMICFTRATPQESTTGCNPPALFDKIGISFSEDLPGNRLGLTTYLPEGFSAIDAGSGPVSVRDRILETTVLRSQGTITASGDSGEIEIEIPGTRGQPEG